MVALPDHSGWTIERYLDFERDQETRHEYIQGQVYAMAGASERHNQIASALNYLLYGQILDRPCQVFQRDMRVQVDEDAFFYPDIVVVCGTAHYANERRDILLNPTVLIEVLSPSAADYDRGRKFKQYGRLPGLKDYLLVSQEQIQVDHCTRQDKDTWILREFSGSEARIALPSVGCILLLSDVYRKVNFDETT